MNDNQKESIRAEWVLSNQSLESLLNLVWWFGPWSWFYQLVSITFNQRDQRKLDWNSWIVWKPWCNESSINVKWVSKLWHWRDQQFHKVNSMIWVLSKIWYLWKVFTFSNNLWIKTWITTKLRKELLTYKIRASLRWKSRKAMDNSRTLPQLFQNKTWGGIEPSQWKKGI